MSVRYRLTSLKDNISDKPKKGYYAQVVTKGTIDSKTLCKHISGSCSLTNADMTAALVALSQHLTEYLLDGYNVNVEGLGTFSISAGSRIVNQHEDIHAQSVQVKSINFRPAVSLKKSMQNAKFERD